jgi:PAS domain S-box-containing protein
MRITTTGGDFRSQRLGLTKLLVLANILFFCPKVAAANPDNTRMVVVLYPDNSDGSPGNALVDQGIRSTFATGSPDRIEIYNEYLDVSRSPDGDHQQFQAEFLQRKYSGRKVDLVIAGLSSGLDFALKFRNQVFPRVPIVFCAVDEKEIQARTLPADVIGVPIKMDLIATLALALQLHPDTRTVFVITGKAEFDAYWEVEARQRFRMHEDKVKFVYLTGLPIEDLLKEVAQLPERSIIYYLHVFRDSAGKVLVPADVLEQVAAAANSPIYGHVDSYIGRGIVGGRVFSFGAEGKNAAGLGLRILAGETPERIGVQQTSANTLMFDWRQLRRWKISEASLPPDSVVRNKELSFWDLYKWPIAGAISLCAVEALLIVGLLVQRLSRRRADRRFRQVVEAAPNGIVMVGQDGRIALANAQMEKLFGYQREEMLGQPVEMLVPERSRNQHRADRGGFFASPETRSMGVGRVLFGQRKDGSTFRVEIGLSMLHFDTSPFVLASIVDITKRTQGEEALRQSQRELQVLTGRLIHSQETERRRIARELHDDFNQSLALLSVDLDILGQKPPLAGNQLGGRIHELSARVKQLSSSVHGLSHQLHPSKLEQLGLLAAVRGLCLELTQSHGLPIAFTHHDVPETLPEDSALCLYRVVQEALGNVLKHSGATHAWVDLTQRAGTVYLQVTDDGVGFDPKLIERNGGLGLVSMRERLRLVHGQITFDSQQSIGTRIAVSVPLCTPDQTEVALPTEPPRI